MSAQLAAFKVPAIENEPLVHSYCPNSAALDCISLSFAEILCTGLTRTCGCAGRNCTDGTRASFRGPSHHKWGAGELYVFVDCHWIIVRLRIAQVKTGKLAKQLIPSDHARHICAYHEADESTVARAIEGALAAKAGWEAMPWGDRAAIFLKAADLISKKYRYRLIAATILGQGKNVWQAEIDAAAEVSIVGID